MINRALVQNAIGQNVSELTKFAQSLASFAIVDIGTVVEINDDGTVNVAAFRALGDEAVIYSHIEVLTPGGPNGTFGNLGAMSSGQTCLLFSPLTPVSDTVNEEVVYGSMPFSSFGMKALLVGRPDPDNVQAFFDAVGSFVVSGPGESATFSVMPGGEVVISSTNMQIGFLPDGTTKCRWRYRRKTIDNEGTETETLYNEDWYRIKEVVSSVDATVTTTLFDGSEDEVRLKEVVENPDGSTTTTYFEDDEAVRTVNDNNDGSVDIEIGSDPNVTITINASDGIVITTTQDISIQCDGNMSAEVGGNMEVSVTGNVTAEANGNIDITANGNATISSPNASITGGMLTVNGTPTPTGSGPFCGIPSCLFTGAPHTGTMVSGT